MDTIVLTLKKIKEIKINDSERLKNFPSLSAAIDEVLFFPTSDNTDDLHYLVTKLHNRIMCYDLVTTDKKDILIGEAKLVLSSRTEINLFPRLYAVAEKIIAFEGKLLNNEKIASNFYRLKLEYDYEAKILDRAVAVIQQIEIAALVKINPVFASKLKPKQSDELLIAINNVIVCKGTIEEATIEPIERKIEKLNKILATRKLPFLDEWFR
jgi:hypothetical protein